MKLMSDTVDSLNGKTKHPNQYTYRPKPPSSSQPATAAAPSPARRGATGGGTPAPPSIAPPQHEHGTRRAGAIAHGAIAYPNLSATSVAHLNWYLPDYLAPYSDLLPTPQPVALDVRSQRTLPHISRNHYLNQRYGPFNEERDEEGRLILPDENSMREPTGEAETHLEPPARIKYPARRITVGEIRKRVRSMLDYVSKAQSMEEKRLERNKALGIVVTPLPKKGKSKQVEDSGMDIDANGDTEMESTDPELEDKDDHQPVRTSMELMEELTRDLFAFQETYMTNNGATPLPPPIPNFEPPLPVPDFPAESDSAAEPTAEDPVEVGVDAPAEIDAQPEVDMEEAAVPEEGDEREKEEEKQEKETETEKGHDATESMVVDEPESGLDQEPTPSIEAAHDESLDNGNIDKLQASNTDQATDIPASSFEIPIPDPTSNPATDSVPEPDSVITLDSTDELEPPLSLPQPIGSSEVTIEQASEEQTTDVYREGEVDKIMISGQEERNVVESLDEVGEITGTGTGAETGPGVQVVEPVV